jgi:hypothetical protein
MSSSGLRKQHNRQLNICWREQYICLHLDWENNTIDNWIPGISWREQCICLHLDWENNTIDNGISVGRNRHMHCSLQQIPGIQLSIVLFSQSRWRHMHCSLQQIFDCLLCCSLNPDVHLDWESNTKDHWISVGGNSTYVFIWIERTT